MLKVGLQITTSLQISPPYIAPPPPTPINTKVHKHLQWNKSPYPTHPNQITSPQLPNYSHIQHKKYSPHYYYYTDGSFTPPKKVTVVIWDPARAGYGIWNPLLKMNISQRLIGLQNILRTEISAIHHTLLILNHEFPHEPAHIFTDSLNSLYLIKNPNKTPNTIKQPPR
jgi:hypothetical protein